MGRYALEEIRLAPDAPRAAPELEPSQRLPQLPDAPRDLASALAALCCLVVGVGSIGFHYALWAAQAGFRSIVLIDPDRLTLTNLLTCPIAPGELGLPKVLAAGRRAKALGPRTRVYAFEGDFEALPLHVVASADWLLLATDNLLAEVQVAQRALHLGLHVIQAAVHGPTLGVQIRTTYGGGDGSGPCLACSFGAREREQLDSGTRYACSGEDAGRALGGANPTRSTAYLCSVAAGLGFLELTRRAVGVEDPDACSMLDFCAFNSATSRTPLVRRKSCFLEHQRHHLSAPPDAGLGARTPRALLEAAGLAGADPRRVTLEAEGLAYVSMAHCECAAHPVVGRFLPRPGLDPSGQGEAADLGARCPRCGSRRRPHPMHVREQVPLSLLASQLDTSLAALGAPEPTSLRLRSDAGSALFLKKFPEV